MNTNYENEAWNKLVETSKAQLSTDCPLQEDELVLWADKRIKQLEQERDQLKNDVARIERRLDHMFDDMLKWRGIERELGDKPCGSCSGSGVRVYGSTSTWRGGIGGQAVTSDVCDTCWGSGNQSKPWTNLRQKAQESL